MAIWADAVFVWDPGDAVTASSDLISTNSASGITEGTYVSSPRPGRTYSGAVGSRFDGLVAVSESQASTVGFTMMAAINSPTDGDAVWGVTVSDKDVNDEYAGVRMANTTDISGQVRSGGSSQGAGNWPFAQWQGDIGDNDIHVVILRVVGNSGFSINDLFVDGALYVTDAQSDSLATDFDIDRIVVGRLEDSSPSNSTGGGVYAAAIWDRPLTDAEIRALSSDPYSYPDDPSDPDDWEEGTVGTPWEEVAFVWDPNHGGSSINRLYGGGPSNGSLTEGSEVTVSSIDGREYDSGEGSRFDIVPLNMSNRFKNSPGNGTALAVIRKIDSSAGGHGIFWGNGDDTDVYGHIAWVPADDQWRSDARVNTGTLGTDWMRALVDDTDDTDFHVAVARLDDTNNLLDLFVDTIGNTDQDNQTYAPPSGIPIKRITVGRQDDSTPSESTTLQVFMAAYWDRLLSDSEITELLANPYSFPGTGPISVTEVSESETAQTVNVVTQTSVAVGAASESESAQTVVPVNAQIITVTAASETETASSVTVSQGTVVSVTAAAETETASAVAVVTANSVSVTAVSETESAQTVAVAGDQIIGVTTASETEAAQTVTVRTGQNIVVDAAAETEVASNVIPTQIIDLGVLSVVGTAATGVGVPTYTPPVGGYGGFPGEPPVGKIYWGASIGDAAGPARHETPTGLTMRLHRIFFQTAQSDTTMAAACESNLAAGRLPWMSFKTPVPWSQPSVSYLENRIGAISDITSGPVWLAVYHEPDNDSGSGTPAQWCGLQERARIALDNLRPHNIAFMPVLIAYTWHQNSGRNPNDWYVDGIWDFMGFDIYGHDKPPNTLPYWGTLKAFCANKGLKMGFAEWGVDPHPTTSSGGDWVQAWWDTAKTSQTNGDPIIIAQSCYDSNTSGNFDWELEGTGLSKFREIMGASQGATIDDVIDSGSGDVIIQLPGDPNIVLPPDNGGIDTTGDGFVVGSSVLSQLGTQRAGRKRERSVRSVRR